jgi:curved DNA-binding protein CbpA
MAVRRPDPYETLGVRPTAPDAEVRAAYRRLVQLHHPDHNAGSAASTQRFEEVQEAYAEVQRRRRDGTRETPRASASGTRAAPPRSGPPRPAPPRPAPPRAAPPRPPGAAPPPPDPRRADLEREVREAHLARERARRSAREAVAESAQRPSDEELGYVTTDDSLSKILADARAQASERFAEVKEPVAKRVADLLDDIAAKFGGGQPPRE